MPEGKYSVIYADPPWRYDMKRGNGVAENHYPTMSIEEICALPIADIAAKDSALFLWATFPQLKEAFRVMEVRDKIVQLMGDQPRVELFAREKTPGWDVWGNEVACDLSLPARKEDLSGA